MYRNTLVLAAWKGRSYAVLLWGLSEWKVNNANVS